MKARTSAVVRIIARVIALVTSTLYVSFPVNQTTVCGIIVLAIIADHPLISVSYQACRFGEIAACNFGKACGALTVVTAVLFSALDVLADVTKIAKKFRQPIIVVGSVAAVIMSILWLACFAYMTKLWVDADGYDRDDEVRGKDVALLVFAFFSIFIWGSVATKGFKSLDDDDDD